MKDLEGNLSPEKLKVMRYNLARVAHRGGFNADRETHLDAYLKLNTLTGAEREAGLRLRTISRDIEPALQAHAIMALKEALASDGDPRAMARARYQLADLQRRIGQSEAARRDFHLVIQSAQAPKELKEMAGFLLNDLTD